MIPTEGERHDLNQTAQFWAAEGGSTVPTVTLCGIRVSLYLETDGAFRVSVATDEGDLDPAVLHDVEGNPVLRLTRNDTELTVTAVPDRALNG